jgi:hypothetical protein
MGSVAWIVSAALFVGAAGGGCKHQTPEQKQQAALQKQAAAQAKAEAKAQKKQAQAQAKAQAEASKKQEAQAKAQAEAAKKQQAQAKKQADAQAKADAQRAADEQKRQAALSKEQAKQAQAQAKADKQAAEVRAAQEKKNAELAAKEQKKQADAQAKADKLAAKNAAKEPTPEPAMAMANNHKAAAAAAAPSDYYADDKLKVVGYPLIKPENHQRLFDQHMEAMAASGAAQDATLSDADFDGGELNSTGRSNLAAALSYPRADNKVTIYVANSGSEDLAGARAAAVDRYVKASPWSSVAVTTKDGLNPSVTSPASAGLNALKRLDKQSAQGGGSATASGGDTTGGRSRMGSGESGGQ